MKATNHWPAVLRSSSVGVRSTFCSAGNSVNTVIHVSTSPAATHSPSSRMGRISLTASAAKPTAVAKIDAVAATNLLASAIAWCSSMSLPSSGTSTKRECR